MLLRHLAISFLIISASALTLDSSLHLARHHDIAARHPTVKRSSVSARCKKRNPSSSTGVASSTPVATHTASTPSQAPPPSSGSPKSGKVGIAWSQGDTGALGNFVTSKVSAVYTWTPFPPSNTFGLEFYTMLWGADQVSEFQGVAKPGFSSNCMAFNEPDIPSQSNLDPGTAAQIWMSVGQPLRDQGYSTITPAVAFSSPWLEAFFSACKGCQWTYMAAHIYTIDPQKMKDYLTTLHNTFNMPIMVTEFACHDFSKGPDEQASEQQVWAFMTSVTQWMDETDWIVKYFAYGVMPASKININPACALMNEDGTPNALGKFYIGA